MKLLFYVSAHGLGHATRIYAVMEALAARAPNVTMYVRSQLQASVFDAVPAVVQSQAVLDGGVVEKGLCTQDVIGTLERYAGIASRQDRIVDEERRFVQTEGIKAGGSRLDPAAIFSRVARGSG